MRHSLGSDFRTVVDIMVAAAEVWTIVMGAFAGIILLASLTSFYQMYTLLKTSK